MDPTQPVIPYAAPADAGAALEWREADDGAVELIVAPPALWRQLIGPATLLALATGVAGGAAAGTMAAALAVPALMTMVGFIAVAALGVAIPTVGRLWQVARYGRLASVIRVSPATLVINVPSLPPEAHRHWSAAALAEVLIDCRLPFPWAIHVVRVQIWARGGMTSEIRIPWRGGEPLDPVERRVREALALPGRQP